jgi:uncharacterized protein (DUF488 family)
MTDRALTLWTIGHSTRSFDEFVAVLDAHAIQLVVDVRSFPGSRRVPQYGRERLESTLPRHGVDYRWVPALGGRRRPDPDSINVAWTHTAFRAYADHVASDEFAIGLGDLLTVAWGCRTTVMCAELLWWRCHRRIIADVLVSLGIDVLHIRDASPATPHELGPPARMVGGELRYW